MEYREELYAVVDKFFNEIVMPFGRTNAAGGELVIYGDISETDKFIASVNGSPRQEFKFDADGVCRIALAGGSDKVAVLLAKAPGVCYPRFRAVVTKAK